MPYSYRIALVVGIVVTLFGTGWAQAQTTPSIAQFNSDPGANGQLVTNGPGSLTFWNGATTYNSVAFGTCSSFGVSLIAGSDAQIMRFDTMTASQGLFFRPGASVGPNGGGTRINQYTIGFDILARSTDATFSMYNTDQFSGTNSGAGEIIGKTDSTVPGGVRGFAADPSKSNNFQGLLSTQVWTRVVLVVTSSAGHTSVSKHINGSPPGNENVANLGTDGRYSIATNGEPVNIGTLLFGDNAGFNTMGGYINSWMFDDRAYSNSEVSALGGPSVAGFIPVPEPGHMLVFGAVGLGAVNWLRRRRKAAAAPLV